MPSLAQALPELLPEVLPDGLLVALGAVPGAWLRFLLVNRLEPLLPRRHWGTVMVNISACLLLGVVLAAIPGQAAGAGRLRLLLVTGFLGSFSTFSSWMAELVVCLRGRQRREGLLLLVGSLLGGLLALVLGLALGRFSPVGR